MYNDEYVPFRFHEILRLRYSQLLCLRIEPTVLPFSKALLCEYIRYATLASKLLRFALTGLHGKFDIF